MEKKAAVIDL